MKSLRPRSEKSKLALDASGNCAVPFASVSTGDVGPLEEHALVEFV